MVSERLREWVIEFSVMRPYWGAFAFLLVFRNGPVSRKGQFHTPSCGRSPSQIVHLLASVYTAHRIISNMHTLFHQERMLLKRPPHRVVGLQLQPCHVTGRKTSTFMASRRPLTRKRYGGDGMERLQPHPRSPHGNIFLACTTSPKY